MCIHEDEVEALRKANGEIIEILKLLTRDVYAIQIGPISDGISRLISTTKLAEETIIKYDPDFKLSFETPKDTN